MQPIYRLLIVLCLLVPHISFSQDSTIYFNKKWKPCAKDTASYYRNISVQAGKYNVTDYFLFGKEQMTGSFSSANTLDENARDGHFIYYDSLGYKIDEGDYSAGRRVGTWHGYFKHSHFLRSIVSYKPDSSSYSVYYDSASHYKISEGGRLEGKRIGVWKFYYEGSNVAEEKEYYNAGEVIKRDIYYDDGILASESFPIEQCIDTARFYDLNGKYEGSCFVYRGPTKMPQLTVNFRRYCRRHLQYPPKAKEACVEGKVDVNFIVNENGSISNVVAGSHIGGGCDAEAERLVATMPWFRPGKFDHKNVKCYCRLKVVFKLKHK